MNNKELAELLKEIEKVDLGDKEEFYYCDDNEIKPYFCFEGAALISKRGYH